MRNKNEFMDLSKDFNENINEDMLLFVGFINNFYLSNKFKSDKEIKESIELYFNVKLESKTKIEMITEFTNKVLYLKENEFFDISHLLNRIFLAMNEMKNGTFKFKDSYEAMIDKMEV